MDYSTGGAKNTGTIVINGSSVTSINVRCSPDSCYYYATGGIRISYTAAATYGWTTPAGQIGKITPECVEKLKAEVIKRLYKTIMGGERDE